MSSNQIPLQRRSEWLEGADWDLHEKQFHSPYRINQHFFDWLSENDVIMPDSRQSILEVGAGMGANLFHLSRRFPGNNFLGVDINPDCVSRGNEKLAHLGTKASSLETADLFHFPESFAKRFDGIVSLATLSWLSEFEQASSCFIDLGPNWIAATSLFCPGSVEAVITTRDHSKPLNDQPYTDKFYNVYSLDRVKAFFLRSGYSDFRSKRFEIDIDLPRPDHGGMGTYTETLQDGGRLQISGPVLMSWHFILARRTD